MYLKIFLYFGDLHITNTKGKIEVAVYCVFSFCQRNRGNPICYKSAVRHGSSPELIRAVAW